MTIHNKNFNEFGQLINEKIYRLVKLTLGLSKYPIFVIILNLKAEIIRLKNDSEQSLNRKMSSSKYQLE